MDILFFLTFPHILAASCAYVSYSATKCKSYLITAPILCYAALIYLSPNIFTKVAIIWPVYVPYLMLTGQQPYTP